MKFSVWYSVIPLYFICFVKAVPEPGPITSVSRLAYPISYSLGIPDVTDLFSCSIVQNFIIYVSAMCTLGIQVDDLGTLSACIMDKLAGPLGALFSALINTLVLGVRSLGKGCETPLTYWNNFVGEKCPALKLLNGPLLKLAGIGR